MPLVAFLVGTDSQDTILVEAEPGSGKKRLGDPNSASNVTRRGASEVIQQAGQSLEQALDRLRPAAQMIVDKLKSASPDELTVEFGVKLEAEAGVVITKAATEAHFKIALKWKPSSSSKSKS